MAVFRPGKPRISVSFVVGPFIPSGEAILLWDEVRWSEGDISYSPGTGLITIHRTGLYWCGFSVQRGAVTQASIISARLQVNGVNRTRSNIAATTSAASAQGGTFEELTENDTLGLAVQAATGAGQTAGINELSFLTAVRLGPERWT